MAVKTLVLMTEGRWLQLFDRARQERLSFLSGAVRVSSIEDVGDAVLGAAEVLVTGWGTPRLTREILDRLPRLRAVLHTAGSIRNLVSDELWARGIQVSTAADANAGPVAEFTLAMLTLAGKRAPFLANAARTATGSTSDATAYGEPSNDRQTIGVVGFSRVGRLVVDGVMARFRDVTCLVADPFADQHEVATTGARLVPLEEMLPQVDILTLHAPALPSTAGMIGSRQLAEMKDHACIVNTARGALIDTAALEAECGRGRLNAILDHTDPMPLPNASPLRTLPNVMLTPHIAGSLGSERYRLADSALDELERIVAGEPLEHRVFAADMDRSA